MIWFALVLFVLDVVVLFIIVHVHLLLDIVDRCVEVLPSPFLILLSLFSLLFIGFLLVAGRLTSIIVVFGVVHILILVLLLRLLFLIDGDNLLLELLYFVLFLLILQHQLLLHLQAALLLFLLTLLFGALAS